MIDANEMPDPREKPKAWEHLEWDAMPWPDEPSEPRTVEEEAPSARDTPEHSA
jgi:hypothetical protein